MILPIKDYFACADFYKILFTENATLKAKELFYKESDVQWINNTGTDNR